MRFDFLLVIFAALSTAAVYKLNDLNYKDGFAALVQKSIYPLCQCK